MSRESTFHKNSRIRASPEAILLEARQLNKQKSMQSLYKLIKEFTSGVGIDQQRGLVKTVLVAAFGIPVSHVRNREKGLVRAMGAREEQGGVDVDGP